MLFDKLFIFILSESVEIKFEFFDLYFLLLIFSLFVILDELFKFLES